MSEPIYHEDKKKNEGPQTPDAGHVANPDVAHEVSDVNVGAIAKFIGALLISLVAVVLIVTVFSRYLASREQASQPRPSPVALRGQEQLPPGPRLQGAPGSEFPLQEPPIEMKALREEWRQQLEAGGVDPKTGRNRIPIEEAKRLLAEKGLPTRAQNNAGPATQQGRGDVPETDYSSSGQKAGQVK